MATSDFWRELAIQFRAIPDFGDLRADWRTVGGGAKRWEVKSPTPFLKDIFEDFARKAASEIADPGVSDLAVAWLEALKDDGYNVQSSGHLTGSIHRLCEASANFCKKLETRAEFKEKHPAVALVPTPSETESGGTLPPRSEQDQEEDIERHSGGKPPKQLVLHRERPAAQEPLSNGLNAARLRDLASREPAEPETRLSHDPDEATRIPPPAAARTLSKCEAKKQRDAAILEVWSRRKKGDIDYGRVCHILDDRKISVVERWPKDTWCGNLKNEFSKERTKKYIHDVIRPPRRRPLS